MTVKPIFCGSLVLLLIVISVQSVQAGATMNEEQMRQMMSQAEEMRKCFGNIDQSAVKVLETAGKKMETEIRALCRAGKRGEAENTAMKFGNEMTTSKEFQEIKKCGAVAQQMMAQMPAISPDQAGRPSGHVCDNL